ncbi:TetR/AcrR family transcriptional regulator [Maritalea myrionectae]|nr:TetR/AcrR family transcriptional regulator [Maritalea myrionectae]
MMDKNELTKREQAKRAKRQLILKSAMDCFIEQGIAQTGIRDIADHAKISLGNLYNHFRRKDELIAEIARIEAQAIAPLISELQTVPAKSADLKPFIDAYLRQISSPAYAILSVEILAAAIRQPKLAEPFEANRKAMIKALVQNTQATTADLEMLLDAIEALGMRCGLEQRKPRRAEKSALYKLAETLT